MNILGHGYVKPNELPDLVIYILQTVCRWLFLPKSVLLLSSPSCFYFSVFISWSSCLSVCLSYILVQENWEIFLLSDVNSCFTLTVLYSKKSCYRWQFHVGIVVRSSNIFGVMLVYLSWNLFAIVNILFYLAYVYLRYSFGQVDKNHWEGLKPTKPLLNGNAKKNKGERKEDWE